MRSWWRSSRISISFSRSERRRSATSSSSRRSDQYANERTMPRERSATGSDPIHHRPTSTWPSRRKPGIRIIGTYTLEIVVVLPPLSRFGGKATVVLASLLRFAVSWVRVGAGFAVLPASDDAWTFGWGGPPTTSLAANARPPSWSGQSYGDISAAVRGLWPLCGRAKRANARLPQASRPRRGCGSPPRTPGGSVRSREEGARTLRRARGRSEEHTSELQ